MEENMRSLSSATTKDQKRTLATTLSTKINTNQTKINQKHILHIKVTIYKIN